MNRILSWKLNNVSYAYIFPLNNTYISNIIPEDSPLWVNIIREINEWNLSEYKNNFNKMAAEVKSKFGIVIPWKDEYWDLGIDGSINGVNIVLLSGKGGDGGYSGDSAINSEVYEEFNKMIDAELQKAREEIEKKNAEVKAFVETKVTETISAAKQTIAETKAEIDETRDELEGKLAGATEALDKAAALFELGEGGIDGEAIKDVMNSVSAHTTWLNTYSGSVADFQTDYDIATKRLGEMTVASSVTDGLFSRFATSMNVVSGTVGSVERTMNAAYGEIRDAAEWIDTNKDSVANVTRYISASAAVIEDKVKYIDNDLTSVIERTVDGKNATIRDEIKAETASGLTNVRNEMNALSGSILQELTHYAPDSAITSIGNRMDALNTTMSEWMTKTDSAMSMTHDLREEWSIESGKISTVTNLVAKTDANGEIEYWISGTTGEEIRVSRTENGSWVDNRGNFYNDNRVYVHYSDTLGSYIQQEVSAISMSVMGKDNVTAAIQLAVKEDADNGGEAIINMVANKVVIDADMIARAITAKTANIGGIMIGDGYIKSMSEIGGKPSFFINGRTGSIYGQNVEVTGKINALEGSIGAVDIDSEKLTIKDKLGNDNSDDAYNGVVAFLNGGDDYSNKINGKLIFASGFSDKREELYEYESSKQNVDYNTIYLTKKYSHEDNVSPDDPLLAYELDENNNFIEITDASFYFHSKEVSSAVTSDFITNKVIGYQTISDIVTSTTITTYWEEYVYTIDENSNKIPYKFRKTINGFAQKINTKIYANGLIETESLNVKNGYLSGTIKANGIFNGELQNAYGSLKNANIYNSNINGNISLKSNNEIKCSRDNITDYFTVSSEKLSNEIGDKYEIVKGYSWSRQNANGNNNGQTYTPSEALATIYFQAKDVVTIPEMTGSIYRYVPRARTNNSSRITVNIVHYEGNQIKKQLSHRFTFGSISDKKSATEYFKTPTYAFSAQSSGYVTININASIHLSTYYWLGLDKAYCSFNFNPSTEKVIINREDPTPAVKIGSNGISVITPGDTTMHILDNSIRIYTKNNGDAIQGIKIQKDGFYIRFSKDSTWRAIWADGGYLRVGEPK